jgi:hypothetical protein
MKRLYLSAALIIVTIGSMIAMQDSGAPQELNALEAQKMAFQTYRDDLKKAVDQASEQLKNYSNDEPAIDINDLLIYKFNPDSYITADTPEDAVELLKVYANMMKDTYIAFANQFEEKENLVPISARTYYTAEDYKNTYENLVESYIDNQIERIDGEIAALE